MSRPKLHLNVLYYNGGPWYRAGLDSLLKEADQDTRILAVDNASPDGTADKVRAEFPTVEVLETGGNHGFAEGHNIGIRRALEDGAEWVALLNQDLKAAPGFLAEFRALCQEHPEFDVWGPMQLGYEDGAPMDPGFDRILAQNEGYVEDRAAARELKRIYEVPQTFGAAMIVSRRAFEKVGGFDPHFFMYSEEGDWFQRAVHHGVRTAVATRCAVRHFHTSRYPTKRQALRIALYAYPNTYVMILKDPRRSTAANLGRWLARLAQDCGNNLRSLPGGLIKIAIRLALQPWIVVRLPFILARRAKDAQGANYL